MGKKVLYDGQKKELKRLQGTVKPREFAIKLGVAPRTYARYVSGERKMPDGLLKLARLLEVDMISEQLLHGTEHAAADSHLTTHNEKINNLVKMAVTVLNSDNPMAADALEKNIQYFAHAIEVEQRLRKTEVKIEAMEMQIHKLQAVCGTERFEESKQKGVM